MDDVAGLSAGVTMQVAGSGVQYRLDSTRAARGRQDVAPFRRAKSVLPPVSIDDCERALKRSKNGASTRELSLVSSRTRSSSMVCRAPASSISNGSVAVEVGVAANEPFTLMVTGDVHCQVSTVSQEVMLFLSHWAGLWPREQSVAVEIAVCHVEGRLECKLGSAPHALIVITAVIR